MPKKMSKLAQAKHFLRVVDSTPEHKLEFWLRNATAKQIYARMVEHGCYWNVAKQDWQNIKLTLSHVQSAAQMFGKADTVTGEYLDRLVAGGILKRTDKGYKRTKRVELSGSLGAFNYGR